VADPSPSGGTGRRPSAPGGLSVVQALVNSVDIESGRDDLTAPAEVRSWMVGRGLLPADVVVGPSDVAAVVELREALRQLLSGNNGADIDDGPAGRILDEVAEAGGVRLRFAGAGPVHLEVTSAGMAGALATMVVAVAESMAQGTWTRLKACREATCQWAFYDRSKNHSGSWCDMAVCGSRVKMRRYRSRRKAGPG
jgi:predicted RNA-binding Zn ribbon-like protein